MKSRTIYHHTTNVLPPLSQIKSHNINFRSPPRPQTNCHDMRHILSPNHKLFPTIIAITSCLTMTFTLQSLFITFLLLQIQCHSFFKFFPSTRHQYMPQQFLTAVLTPLHYCYDDSFFCIPSNALSENFPSVLLSLDCP